MPNVECAALTPKLHPVAQIIAQDGIDRMLDRAAFAGLQQSGGEMFGDTNGLILDLGWAISDFY